MQQFWSEIYHCSIVVMLQILEMYHTQMQYVAIDPNTLPTWKKVVNSLQFYPLPVSLCKNHCLYWGFIPTSCSCNHVVHILWYFVIPVDVMKWQFMQTPAFYLTWQTGKQNFKTERTEAWVLINLYINIFYIITVPMECISGFKENDRVNTIQDLDIAYCMLPQQLYEDAVYRPVWVMVVKSGKSIAGKDKINLRSSDGAEYLYNHWHFFPLIMSSFYIVCD